MPNAKGVWRVQWLNCARCGFLTPIDHLRRQQGLLLCFGIRESDCTDDLSILYRDKQIQVVLAQPGEGTSEASERFKDPGEIVEF
jgi:hypothetical protein